MSAARAEPRLVAPTLLPAPHQEVWWAGAKAGYDCGFYALQGRKVPLAPEDLTSPEKQVWWMGYRTAHPYGFQDMREGLPFTEPPAQPEHIWPEDEEDGA